MLDDLDILVVPLCILAAIGALVVGLWWVFDGGRGEAAFMAECTQDHKKYECTAMWRSGESGTSVMPMPIIIPGR